MDYLKYSHGDKKIWSAMDELAYAIIRTTSEGQDKREFLLHNTSKIWVSEMNLVVHNPTWSFESAMLKQSVTGSGKYAFEVEIISDGIMQIGWSSKFDFDPFLGRGVGDDADSYAFDGCRVRKWHGEKFDVTFALHRILMAITGQPMIF